MKRKEQIKQAAREAATIVEGVAENGNKYCTIIPEWQDFFEKGAYWSDEHPAPFTPETHLGRERIGQMRKLWSTAYEHLIEVAMEEHHTPKEIALIFFELGFRAADENPFVRKEE